MSPRILLNGESYAGLSALPPDLGARVESFADLPLWTSLPDHVVLAISTVNVTPRTWPTTAVQHLPALPPSAVRTVSDEGADSREAQSRRAVSALARLYTSHYAPTLSGNMIEKLVGLASDEPEAVAEELSNLYPTYFRGTTADAFAQQGGSRHELGSTNSRTTAADASYSIDFNVPADLNPKLWHDGETWRLDIPQNLYVEIQDGERDEWDTDAPEVSDTRFAIEFRRVVQYTANEKRDISQRASGRSVRSDWNESVPPPPSKQLKAFERAVTGQEPMFSSSRLLSPIMLILIIGTFTIIAFIVIVLTFIAVAMG